jgi:hypothetical protein
LEKGGAGREGKGDKRVGRTTRAVLPARDGLSASQRDRSLGAALRPPQGDRPLVNARLSESFRAHRGTAGQVFWRVLPVASVPPSGPRPPFSECRSRDRLFSHPLQKLRRAPVGGSPQRDRSLVGGPRHNPPR